jgi:predicted ATPase
MVYSEEIHLTSVEVKCSPGWPDQFPYRLPLWKALGKREFHAPVTFLVGENGCGKSTLLEAIACAAGSITVGSVSAYEDPTLKIVREFSNALKCTWSKKTNRGFFMRSEDFFGYSRKMAQAQEELQQNLEEVERDYRGRSETARQHARMPYQSELSGIKSRYGDGLDTRSHGESYLTLFQSRFVPSGLYLLDEPEAPLSPIRQLTFLAMLKKMVEQKAQFLIATHSPILMAYPGAEIIQIDGGNVRSVSFEEVEHVRVTRAFLECPERYLRHLFEE